MINFNDNWEYCAVCDGAFIRCPDCGNNCCNGGYGKVNGVTCTICPDAYKFQKKAYECKQVPCVTTLKGWTEREQSANIWEKMMEEIK